MRYLGSKASTAEIIYRLVANYVSRGTFCDPFGGIGVVGAVFKQYGYTVWSGDILRNAYNFQVARLERQRLPSFRRLREILILPTDQDVVDYLNSAVQRGGWFEREYAKERRFFTRSNAMKIAGCRRLIYHWDHDGLLSSSEKSVLLASLVNSMDKVANTAGTYYAYLKSWYRKALRPFKFELLKPTPGTMRCYVKYCPAEELIRCRHFDVLYLDPPYNDRCYAGYYHLPETIALQTTPRVYGRSGVPARKFPKSDYNRPGKARDALTNLLSHASFRLLVFHYADNGLISRSHITSLLSDFGSISEFSIGTRGYSTRAGRRRIQQRVYVVRNA